MQASIARPVPANARVLSALALRVKRPASARSCQVQKLGFCSGAKLPRQQHLGAPSQAPQVKRPRVSAKLPRRQRLLRA
jgi:hypothetical protein